MYNGNKYIKVFLVATFHNLFALISKYFIYKLEAQCTSSCMGGVWCPGWLRPVGSSRQWEVGRLAPSLIGIKEIVGGGDDQGRGWGPITVVGAHRG